jgi:hypothetical protein
MNSVPISISRLKVKERGKDYNKYIVQIQDKNSYWTQSFVCDRDHLLIFKNEIESILDSSTTSEILNISEETACLIDKHYVEDSLCQECSMKFTRDCIRCLFEAMSPLERKLFLALKKKNIPFQMQYGLDWKGQHISTNGRDYNDQHYNFKEVLTIVDFYLKYNNFKLCVYTDGHSYHERTEEQAQHDRRIDRALQEFGYTVLRFTGKDINDGLDKVISEIERYK